MEHLSFVRPASWAEVLSEWRDREAEWGWEEVWRSRGFESWDAWRATYTAPLQFQERTWEMYRVDEPAVLIPKMWAVAYKGWKRYYPVGAGKAQLADIARHSDLPANSKVIGLRKSFPGPTTIIGIRQGEELAVFEGLHRCATIALEAQNQRQVARELTIALTEFGSDEAGLFEKAITQKA